jgi:hypothetical protein
MRSRSEPEALEIFRHVRTHPQDCDMSVLINGVRSGCAANTLSQQIPQQQRPTNPNHCQQREHHLRPQPQTQPQQQQPQNTIHEPITPTTGTLDLLPPLRSILPDLYTPAAGGNTMRQPLRQALPSTSLAQRQMSQVPYTPNSPYSSASSSGRQEQLSL